MSESGELFRFGAFAVSEKGLEVLDQQASEDDWQKALRKAMRARSGLQWAIGDLLLYADERQFNDGMVEATMEATGMKRGTIHNIKSVARAFPKRERQVSLSWSHHALVAGFSESERSELLARARRDKLSWEELRAETSDRRRLQRLASMEFPQGTFGLLLADPWRPTVLGAPTHMPTDQVAALAPRVQAITAPSAVLYLWAPSGRVASGEASAVVQAWGFVGRDAMVWVKDTMEQGAWTRPRHEHLLVGTRGNPVQPEDLARPDSVLTGHRGMHDQRPVEAYEVLERCYAGVPKVELFARQPREGWASWGNEVEAEEPARGVRIREEVATA